MSRNKPAFFLPATGLLHFLLLLAGMPSSTPLPGWLCSDLSSFLLSLIIHSKVPCAPFPLFSSSLLSMSNHLLTVSSQRRRAPDGLSSCLIICLPTPWTTKCPLEAGAGARQALQHTRLTGTPLGPRICSQSGILSPVLSLAELSWHPWAWLRATQRTGSCVNVCGVKLDLSQAPEAQHLWSPREGAREGDESRQKPVSKLAFLVRIKGGRQLESQPGRGED